MRAPRILMGQGPYSESVLELPLGPIGWGPVRAKHSHRGPRNARKRSRLKSYLPNQIWTCGKTGERFMRIYVRVMFLASGVLVALASLGCGSGSMMPPPEGRRGLHRLSPCRTKHTSRILTLVCRLGVEFGTLYLPMVERPGHQPGVRSTEALQSKISALGSPV